MTLAWKAQIAYKLLLVNHWRYRLQNLATRVHYKAPVYKDSGPFNPFTLIPQVYSDFIFHSKI